MLTVIYMCMHVCVCVVLHTVIVFTNSPVKKHSAKMLERIIQGTVFVGLYYALCLQPQIEAKTGQLTAKTCPAPIAAAPHLC